MLLTASLIRHDDRFRVPSPWRSARGKAERPRG
jgi:hypothetical protein